MRGTACLILGLVLAAGCIVAPEEPSSTPQGGPTSTQPVTSSTQTVPTPTLGPAERALPVVKIASTFVRTYTNGTQWSPPNPYHHGCSDWFDIDEAERQILVHDYGGGHLT